MATDIKETVLVDIRIEKGDNERQVDNLTKSLTALTEENKELVATNKALAAQGQQNSKAFLDNARQVELNKQKIQQNANSRKGLIQTIIAEDNSIKALRVQNAELIRQRDLINTKTDQGRARIAALNAQLDRNNATIQKNSSQLEKQKINIGNYASALGGLSPALGGFVNGMQNATVAAKTFIATPLGLALTAIGVALAPLVTFFTQTGEGADIASREAEGFRSVMRNIRDELVGAGKSQKEFFDGLLQGFLNSNPLLRGLANQYNALAAEGRAYADAIDEVKDSEENYGIKAAKTENQIKRLILEAKNRTLSEEERISKLQEAVGLEETLQTQREDFAKRELSAIIENNRRRLEAAGIVQTAEETQAQFAENNIDRIRAFDEALAKSLIKSVIKLEEAAGSSIAITEKAQNLIDQLEDKRAERDKKASEERIKQGEEELKQKQEYYQLQVEYDQRRAEEQKAIRDQEHLEELERQAEFDAILDAYAKKRAKEDKERADKNKEYADRLKQLKDRELTEASRVSAGLAAISKRDTIAQKGFTLTSIALNTAQGISAATKAGAGIPFPGNLAAILAGIAAVLGGIAQAKNALGFILGGVIPGYAGGGSVSGTKVMAHHGRPIRRANGDDRLITAKVGETVVNDRQKAALGGDDAFRKAGIPGYATGGFIDNETRIATQAAGQSLDLNQLSDVLISKIVPVLVYEEFELKASQINTSNQRAVVIA